jgi:aminopeptidase-like protein
MKEALEQLFTFDRRLLGAGYDNALAYLGHLIDLEVIELPSGSRVGTWTVPDEWVPKEAWIKYKGKKILDFSKEPLCLTDYSMPVSKKVSKEELEKHLHTHEELNDAIPYSFRFYDRDWGFSMSQKQKDKLKDGEYEVFIDAETRPGKMKIGVHTIPGRSDREILIFAHLDHPHQANDNLSGVACLLDLAKNLKAEHTIKLIFCPETIGSIAYAHTQNLDKVDFAIAVDICGNDNTILFQKSWDEEARINRVVHCALQVQGKPYRKGKFRTSIGSDETTFNDPLLNIPGILFSTWPYKEYHSNQDTPELINYEKIQEMSALIQKVIEIYEKDFIPMRLFRGPLMRSRYQIQSPIKRVNLIYDYVFYMMDGKQSLAEICAEMEVNFEDFYLICEKITNDQQMLRTYPGQER